MPYTIAQNDSGEYCVFKKAPDGNPEGDTLGCHPTKDKAVAQIGAIESSEAGKSRAKMTMGRREDGIERRDMLMQELELRADPETGAPTVEGYAAVFNSLSEVLFEFDSGRFREKVAPGAFSKTIREQNISLLVEHADLPLATTKSGTLKLWEDDRGLRFSSVLEPSDPDVQRLVPKMRRGDMNRCSFGFIPVRDAWDDKPRPRVRTLHEVKLADVSIVARPAYPATEAKVRKALADDGLDPESIADLLVRLRLGQPLDDEDMTMMRRLVDTCRRYLPEDATATEAAPELSLHPVEVGQPATNLQSAPELSLHPPSYYRDWLKRVESETQ